MKAPPSQKVTTILTTSTNKTTTADGNEIILILEDSVKCYQTEDTPYVISNAASATDLRQSKVVETSSSVTVVEKATKSATVDAPAPLKKYHRAPQYVSGSYTPEKPISYAEEGTPGYFSRYESLSSLDESPPDNGPSSKAVVGKTQRKQKDPHKIEEANSSNEHNSSPKEDMSATVVGVNEIVPRTPRTPQTNLNSAQETPLMFSRHSSMDSLVEEDAVHIDDKSSVVSDFSRLASGVISPSELPDSPTQSMPQSPRRNSGLVQQNSGYSAGMSPVTPRSINGACTETKRPLRSVFEDDLSTFHVENTPAQFSCATSLSNLSVIDDEASPPSQMVVVQAKRNLNDTANTDDNVENNVRHAQGISEGEEEDTGGNNDDMLLASCINIGMNRSNNMVPPNLKNSQHSGMQPRTVLPVADEPRQYFTEDTPALLSKVGSNSNLSAISICSSSNEHKDDTTDYKLNNHNSDGNANNRRSLNLSDDVSSNASESGAIGQSYDILQECIREGMKKTGSGGGGIAESVPRKIFKPVMDPIAMMRRGGNILPPYLPVTDEMSKYIVEDSPCNFSVVSGLSNLTVGSSLVGPAIHLKENDDGIDRHQPDTNGASGIIPPKTLQNAIHQQADQQWQDDSLSSLSIDSEDDTNLLSQAIAAGCNRPKSNLGFSSSNVMSSNNGATNKRSTSLSSSQPIPINSATSASSLNSVATMRSFHQRKHNLNQQNANNNVGQNESYSSVDSSDSNDNQSKSLFELCILSGMHKTRDNGNHRKAQSHHHSHEHSRGNKPTGDGISAAVATQSNPNLKISSSHSQNRHIRERERKDEKLLLECINTGISKKISGSGGNVNALENKQPRHHHHHHQHHQQHQHQQVNGAQHMAASGSVAVPKNVLATSVAAQAVSHPMVGTTLKNAHNIAAPDVEKNNDIISNNNNNTSSSYTSKYTTNSHNTSNNINHAGITDDPESQALKQPLSQHQTPDASPQNHVNVPQNVIGYNMVAEDPCSLEHTTSDESNQSFILETTVSLEHKQATVQNTMTSEKHKDPDLMLKSVERLTMEFVTSAEQLRTNSDSLSQNSKQKCSISAVGNNSNNTWNEDTCPNDVSFPSVSITAPVMASLSYDDDEDEDENDADEATEADHKELHDFAEITPTNEEQPAPSMEGFYIDEPDIYINTTQPNSLQTETETIVDDCITQTWNTANVGDAHGGISSINFQVGGEVQSAAASLANKRLYLNSNSAMTNSAIIAIEARKLAENLKFAPMQDDESSELTFSINSLDLDNVRPPSGMDSLNMSGFYQDITATHSQPNSMTRVAANNFMPHSPQFSTKSPKFPRKSLPAAIVARRALGHLTGSAESVNSSCYLLDNIKPPSLMDELLDSMISVASIQSEVAEQDCQSMATTISVSNYETAASGGNDFDDNTVTLQSCCDNMPRDEDEDRSNSAGTPLPNDNDFSSAESTPKKSPLGLKRTLTPKQKRRLAQDRFKTYTIAADMVLNDNDGVDEQTEADETLQIEITETINSNARQRSSENGNEFKRRGSHERYKTQTINFPSELLQANVSLESNDDCLSEEMSSIKAMTQRFKFITKDDVAAPDTTQTSANEPLDGNSCDYEQNSETESCRRQSLEHISDNKLDDINENEHPPDGGTKQPRIVKPCAGTNIEDVDVEESQIKAIRGRKKPAYVSPYSMQFQRTNPTSTVSKPQTRAAVNGKRITKPNTFINTTKLAQKKRSMEVTSTTNEQSNQQQQQLLPPNNNGLDRQGTFVKDEPSTAAVQVPIVESSSPAKPKPTTPSKLPMKRTNSNMTSPKMSNIATTRKLGTTTTRGGVLNASTKASSNMRKIPTIANKSAAMAQRSNSNANIRITSNAARIAVLSTRVSATTPPSRSNSNLNAVSSTAAASAKITQAQSRIASIWKRVDDVKHRQQQQLQQKYTQQKTVNQAASSDLSKQRTTAQQAQQEPIKLKSSQVSTNLNSTKAQHIEQSKEVLVADPPQLLRSSTYDNIPTAGIGNGSCTTASKLVAPTIARKMLPVPVTGRK